MDFSEFKDILTSGFPEVTDVQLSRFEAMEGLYREWNSKINVVSRKDIDNLYEHHILHSLCIALYLKCQRPELFREWAGDAFGGAGDAVGAARGAFNGAGEAVRAALDAFNGAGDAVGAAQDALGGGVADIGTKRKRTAKPLTVLDLGCGGGFPGIPLAALFPRVQFTLCDSIGKKVTVAREVAAALGLENVSAVNARAESLTAIYDFVVSRAVTSLENFLPWVKGKRRRDILYLKGGDLVEEIALAMGKFRLPKGSVGVWPISSVLPGEYFAEKMVIDIRR